MILEMTVLGGALYTGACLYEKGREWLRPIFKDTEKQRGGESSASDSLHSKTQAAVRQLKTASSSLDKLIANSDAQIVNGKFTLALGSLGLTSIGLLGYPLLTLLCIPGLVFFVGSFIYSAIRQLIEKRRPGMAVIDAVITSALLYLGYFWAIALYMSFFLFSRKVLITTRKSYQETLGAIIGEIPGAAWIEQNGIEVEIPIAEIQTGDIVVVHAGESIPVDGCISAGVASVDQRILTGEARPVDKCAGDHVFAATLVLAGTIHIQVEQAGADTVAARIKEVLRHTADYTSSIELQGEAIGDKNALPMLALGAITVPLLGPMSALTVVCSYIGYSMRVIGPLSVLNFLKIASRQHILIKDGRALETLARVNTVIFDKTGTLTRQQLHVTDIHSFDSYTAEDVLSHAAAAEYKQSHPVANAILHEAHIRQLDIPPIRNARCEIGYGLKVGVGESQVHIGSARFMESEGIVLPAKACQILANGHDYAYSFVCLAIDNRLAGIIELRTVIRKEAKDIITKLQERGITVLIVSGDHENPTRRLAHDLGVEQYAAEALPEDKADLIVKLRQEGRSVCFVGDGINDSIALKKANVSISLRGASTVATDTAHIILPDDGLNQLVPLFDIAKGLESNMEINFFTSVVPGVVTIGGAYLLNFGLVAAYISYYTGFAAGMTNAMLPLIRHDKKVKS